MTDNEDAKIADIYIADMGFSIRVYNHLIDAGFYTAEDLLLPCSLDKLIARRSFGKASRVEIVDKMRQHGYTEWADIMELK
jgi:DNA-directed RNA polymerase alpha subunit